MAGEPIGVIGVGYVGLVTATCFADLGHRVFCRDIDADKVARLRSGEVPLHEPGLEELLRRNRHRLTFTLDLEELFREVRLAFICVDTPPMPSGDADLSRVQAVIGAIPASADGAALVMKSTVPVGTGRKVRAELDAAGLQGVAYLSNPEFLREGAAVPDFMAPDRIVIGADSVADADRVARLYDGIDAEIVRTDVASAEMIKLAANAFLATKISFINEIANVCETVGADVAEVARGMGLDRRIGASFLRPGLGFGGSCLVGDETVLVRTDHGTQLVQLADLHRDTATSKGMPDDAALLEPSGLEVLAWDGGLPAWYAVSAITRLSGTGRMVEVQTGMGRRVQCTDDHPFVVVDPDSGATRVVLARDLDRTCWLPLAGDAPVAPAGATPMLSVVEYAGPDEGSVFVRMPDEPVEMVDAAQLTVREVALARSRATRERFEELEGLGVAGPGMTPVAALTNVADVPIELAADEAFWRVVGLYLAGGRIAADGGRRRLSWSFSPTGERSLADEVRDYLAVLGVRASARRLAASMEVSVSSHLLAGLFDALGLGRGGHDHAIPGLIFARPEPERRALLAGLWRGQGSWSYVGGDGASVVLEYGTVSRELADGVLRLLSSIGITAGLKVGRAGKATCDTFWIRIAGAGQIGQVLEFVRPDDRETIRASISAQPDTALPTGYRSRGGDALVRVTRVDEVPFAGPVYSLEVPGPHTFVTTHGLVVHNCFPKDVRALKQLAGNTGYHFQLLTAVIEVNELQKRRVIAKLQTHLGDLRGRRVALLGIAFKPNTDDVREASSLVLSSRLVAEGAEVRAYDPIAAGTQLTQVGARVCATVAEALEGADAAVIVTEWNEFRAVLDPHLRDLMARPLLIDGRNLLDPGEAARAGFEYDSIGRPRRAPVAP